MGDGIYVSMAGATAREQQLDSIADDLANSQTPGFKASRPVFASVLAEAGGIRAFPAVIGGGTDLRPGPVSLTGSPLDVLPEDGNFLAVKNAQGQVAFTRDGRISVDSAGTLRAAGLPLVSTQGGSLSVPPNTPFEIGSGGQLLVGGQEVGRLAVFKVDGATQKTGPSLLVPAAGGSVTQVASKIQSGAVEMGNRTALDSMVDMVSAQRHFDASMQALDAYKKMGDTSNTLGKIH
jgi:flagellar basal-body rod protein FlgF